MISRRVALLLPLLAAGCGGEEPAMSFAMPNYSYLTPLRINVASIEIDDRTLPGQSGRLAARAPLQLADMLKQMAHDRLVASGSAGRAVFVVDQASLMRSNGGIDGAMAVHLDVFAGDGGQRAGYAEARVTRRYVSTDSDEITDKVLYNFEHTMMDDMNVEFEYQIKRTLRDWLQVTAGTAPMPMPVQTQELSAPSGPAVRP